MSKRRLLAVVPVLAMMLGGAVLVVNGCSEESGSPDAPKAKDPAPATTPAPAPKAVEAPKAPEAAPKAPVAPKEEPVAAVTPPEEPAGPVLKVDLAAGGTISGKVTLDGRAPRMRKINSQMQADPKCAALHADAVYSDMVVVDKDTKGVKWAFVYVKTGLEGKKFEVPAKPATIDQKGCMYDPHVFGVMVGQEILIRNSDDVVHNIHALPFDNKEFNFAQPQKGMEAKKTFTKKEIMVKFKCDVHPWMGAWAGVLEHPFHATTGADGSFTIAGLPAGKYTVEVWHEVYKSVTAEVTVAEGGKAEANFTLKDKK